MKELEFLKNNKKDNVESILEKYNRGESLVDSSATIINCYKLERKDFIENKSATEEMINFISILLNHNISMCISGNAGSGKTTLLNIILDETKNKKIFTVENGSREFNLPKCEEKNNIVYSAPLYSKDNNLLLEVAERLRFDVICMGEMRDKEVLYLQELSKKGYAVTGTIHSNSSHYTYKRLVNLCKKETNIDDKMLMKLFIESFPIVVYVKQLSNKSRKITEIIEGIVDTNGNISYNTLFRYNDTGYFEKINNISDNIKEKLIKNGITYNELEKIIK